MNTLTEGMIGAGAVVSACAGSTLCSHHVFDFPLKISTVSNCNMKW